MQPKLVSSSPPSFVVIPGSHSHNGKRLAEKQLGKINTPLLRLRIFLFAIGLAALGFYAYTLCDQYAYQAYENWAFNQQIAGHSDVTFTRFVREKVGVATPDNLKSANTSAVSTDAEAVHISRPSEGDLLGRVSIDRLNLSAMVREGVSAATLRIAVGHVPATASPGQPGNFVIAAHRDTLFRALKDIQEGDRVRFQSASGTYIYQVLATKIVKPSDVTVLRADGGGLIPAAAAENTQRPASLLTMITCYPFYYVGSAPKRFIVEAKLISDPGELTQESQAPAHLEPVKTSRRTPGSHPRASATRARNREHGEYVPVYPNAWLRDPKRLQHPGFWHRFFGHF